MRSAVKSQPPDDNKIASLRSSEVFGQSRKGERCWIIVPGHQNVQGFIDTSNDWISPAMESRLKVNVRLT